MTVRRPGRIEWLRRTPPTRAVAEFTAQIPTEVVKDFLADVKKHAGGSVRSNKGQQWPVLTGYSRDRFALAGRLSRGKGKPAKRVLIQSAHYAPFPDTLGGGILNRLWRRFYRRGGDKKAVTRKARRLNRRFRR